MPARPGYYGDGPEALVVSLAARGDRDAFTELVRRRQPWLRNLMRRLSGNAQEADDLAQSVFLKAWRKIRQLRNPERFGPWLKQIAVNEWIDQKRSGAQDWTREYGDDMQTARPRSTTEAIDLDSALGTLPQPVRLCIVLSYHERLSHAEIVDLTGIPAGTVKSHIRRGSHKLRALLSDYGEAQ